MGGLEDYEGRMGGRNSNTLELRELGGFLKGMISKIQEFIEITLILMTFATLFQHNSTPLV